MIESCPKKRMVFGISILAILTLLVLVIESHWTESSKHLRKQTFVVEQNSTCWEKEKYEVIKDCEPCSEFELRSKSTGVCVHTHFKEVLKCANGETVTRSCDRAAFYDEQTFWRFEGCMFVASIISSFCVVSRKKVLNKRTLQRVQRQLANCMDSLFINVYKGTTDYSLDIETLIILFIFKLIDTDTVKLVVNFQSVVPTVPVISINLSNIRYNPVTVLPKITSFCVWPIVVNNSNITAGLCSVARHLIKKSKKPDVKALLGFREACLLACSESSIWTRFCEVDMITTAKKLLCSEYFVDNKLFLPEDVARFEFHMSKPVRMHNVYKAAREKNNNKDIKSSVPIQELNLTHIYGEGTTITLSDVILYPLFKILVDMCPLSLLEAKIPLTINWYRLMERASLPPLNFTVPKMEITLNNIVEPSLVKHSLYTADPNRYRPEKRTFTKQNDIESALKIVNSSQNKIVNDFVAVGHDIPFDWRDIPLEANPKGGALPEKRADRKQEQLENLAKAVVKIAGDNRYRIVDFCSGSGHLGILLAVLLPNCEVVLVENKERSLARARERVLNLKLSNVVIVQSNLDYFQGKFDVGVTLHACGVATDLVIQNCISNRAHFVVCPCCYGGIKDCHHLKYPRSEQFRMLDLGLKNYFSLAHAADQTHDADNAKTKQGYFCMDVVDTDRKLFAESCDYEVHLGKLHPISCTNKNNLLVGLCKGKK